MRPGDVSFVSEHRLSFGITISSNVGQRAAELYLAIFRRRFDAEESAHFAAILPARSNAACAGARPLDEATRWDGTGMTAVCSWIRRRRTLSI